MGGEEQDVALGGANPWMLSGGKIEKRRIHRPIGKEEYDTPERLRASERGRGRGRGSGGLFRLCVCGTGAALGKRKKGGKNDDLRAKMYVQ